MFFLFFGAGKRNVKPSKVTKEMDVDRVCPIFSSLSFQISFSFSFIYFGFFCMSVMLGFRLMGSVM